MTFECFSNEKTTAGNCKSSAGNFKMTLLTTSNKFHWAINTPTYKLATLLISILKPLTSSECTVKNSFVFAEEIIEQDSETFTASLDVDSLFTNIPLEENNDICIGTFFGNTKGVEGLSKIKFKELLSLATKESHFIFNGKFYKQVDGVTIGSLLDSTLTNAFPP